MSTTEGQGGEPTIRSVQRVVEDVADEAVPKLEATARIMRLALGPASAAVLATFVAMLVARG